VIDRPQPSDVAVVPAGDANDARFWRGMELLRSGQIQHLFLDADAISTKYGESPAQAAERFLDRVGGELRPRMHVCALQGGTATVSEAQGVAECVAPWHPRSAMVVTSDYHTRRSLAIFRHVMPQYSWSVAAAHDPRFFGERWWHNREWAKQDFNEWQKLALWNLWDRWRN